MNIVNSTPSELTITGNIKSIDDYTAIRDQIDKLVSQGIVEISLKITESFSMPSSVIGYLLKLKRKEKLRIKIIAGDQRLVTLLQDLSLIDEFGVVHKKT